MADRLKIIDYFDGLVDEIDLKSEKLLVKYASNRLNNTIEGDERVEKLIHERRTSFIETIQDLKKHNLTCLDKKADEQQSGQAIGNETIYDKYCFLLDKYDMKIKNIDLQEDDNFSSHDLIDINETFGYLIVLEDGLLSQQKWNLFKEILFYGYSLEDFTNEEFDKSTENKLFKQIHNCNSHALESTIFNAKLLKALVNIKILSYSSIISIFQNITGYLAGTFHFLYYSLKSKKRIFKNAFNSFIDIFLVSQLSFFPNVLLVLSLLLATTICNLN